jgi:hypothetical protein
MTDTPRPQFVQFLMVLANSRKERFAVALNNARKSLELSTQTAWQPHVASPAERCANGDAERLDRMINSQ